MHERLIEIWLDSASERSYQAAFCQMLNARGYVVLHSTRHSPIEFGKDVIARCPAGEICAYQLKGNPGSRLTGSQLREIQLQLIQLVSQPVSLPGIPQTPHRSFLVTNGEVDEEAQHALREIGDGLRLAGYRYPDIELVPRGVLLAWAKDVGANLWPSELPDVSQLLQILVEDGRKVFPLAKLHSILLSLFGLSSDANGRLSANEVRRRIGSGALLVGIALRNFLAKENYYAAISAWTLFSLYAIGVCERYHVSYDRNGKRSVELAKTEIFDNLCELSEEIHRRGHIVEGNALTDTLFHAPRHLLLSALMAVLWFWADERGWPTEAHREFVEGWIPEMPERGWLWGEACIPQWLAYLWYRRVRDPSPRPDLQLAAVLEAVCQHNGKDQLESYAGPTTPLRMLFNINFATSWERRRIL